MIVHEYRCGSWIALVADGAVALLHPALGQRAARELWEVARAGSRLGGWVEHLAGRGIRALPSFAMVEAHPQGLRVLVRGDVTVTVGPTRVSGAGYATWHEEVLPGEAGFTLTAAAGAGAAADLAAPDPAAPWLPLVGGVVRAAEVRTFDTGHDRHAGLHVLDRGDDVELTLMRSPALAAALGGARAARPAAVAVPDQALPADRSALEDTAVEPPEDVDLTWDTPADGASRAVGPTPGSAGTSATPAPAALPVPADSVAPAASPAPADSPGPDEPPLELVLPTGARVPVTGPVLLGRAPEAGRFRGNAVPRLVAVPNPQRGVSTTHAEVRPAGDHVVVTDMSSTNGTVLHVPGRPPQRLRPGTGVPVPPGGVVELGAEVRVVVERADRTP